MPTVLKRIFTVYPYLGQGQIFTPILLATKSKSQLVSADSKKTFILVFLEFSETYADPSLNEI